MRVESLSLRSFRNYEEEQIAFHPGINLILGMNAQGKTNLLEAVTYLSAGHAFRTRKEKDLISFGADFADLSATVFTHERLMELRAVLFASRRPRQLFLNGVKQKTFGENMAGQLMSVLFCPEDLSILKEGGAGRRRLMDTALCQLRPRYEEILTEYNRLLEHKSRILKDWHEDRSLLQLLPDFNERMCRLGAEMISVRAAYLDALAALARDYHREFSGDSEQLEIQYRSVSNIPDVRDDKIKLYASLKEHMHSHERAELESGQCLSGPHKDDFETYLNGAEIKSYGSQGQTRTAAISLKLAQREIFRKDSGEEPVLLLDDVLSELDCRRQDFILNHLRTGQVIITCCETDRFTDVGKMFTVEKGTVKEVG